MGWGGWEFMVDYFGWVSVSGSWMGHYFCLMGVGGKIFWGGKICGGGGGGGGVGVLFDNARCMV